MFCFSDLVPHKWFINTAEFSTPKELAEYLLELDKDDKTYRKYLEYRQQYEYKHYFGELLRNTEHWCNLCEVLNTQTQAKYYDNIESWWAQDKCTAPGDL